MDLVTEPVPMNRTDNTPVPHKSEDVRCYPISVKDESPLESVPKSLVVYGCDKAMGGDRSDEMTHGVLSESDLTPDGMKKRNNHCCVVTVPESNE